MGLMPCGGGSDGVRAAWHGGRRVRCARRGMVFGRVNQGSGASLDAPRSRCLTGGHGVSVRGWRVCLRAGRRRSGTWEPYRSVPVRFRESV